jgi:hypothetical protein
LKKASATKGFFRRGFKDREEEEGRRRRRKTRGEALSLLALTTKREVRCAKPTLHRAKGAHDFE